jgi:hypothetical protein
MPSKKIETQWTDCAAKLLVGRTITKVSYMSKRISELSGLHSRPLVLTLDNGAILYPMRDDEGNDGGALEIVDQQDSHTLPAL